MPNSIIGQQSPDGQLDMACHNDTKIKNKMTIGHSRFVPAASSINSAESKVASWCNSPEQ